MRSVWGGEKEDEGGGWGIKKVGFAEKTKKKMETRSGIKKFLKKKLEIQRVWNKIDKKI